MHAQFKPYSPHPRTRSTDRSNFSFTNKKHSLDTTSKKPTQFTQHQNPQFSDLIQLQHRKSQQVAILQASLQRNKQQLDMIRRAIRQRKIEDDLRREIEVLEENNRMLERTLEETTSLAEKYKEAVGSACEEVEQLERECKKRGKLNEKLRFLLSYLVERMQDMFARFESQAVKLQGRAGKHVLEGLGNHWPQLRKLMARQQHNLLNYIRNSASQLCQDLPPSNPTSKLIIRQLL